MTGYNYVVTENNIYVHLREHLEERSKPEFVVSFITFEIVVRPAKSNFQPSVESNTRLLEPRGGPHCQRCKTHVSPPREDLRRERFADLSLARVARGLKISSGRRNSC